MSVQHPPRPSAPKIDHHDAAGAAVRDVRRIRPPIQTHVVQVGIRPDHLGPESDHASDLIRCEIDLDQLGPVRHWRGEHRRSRIEHPQTVPVVGDDALHTDEMIGGGVRLAIPSVPAFVRIRPGDPSRQYLDHRVQVQIGPARIVDEYPPIGRDGHPGDLEIVVREDLFERRVAARTGAGDRHRPGGQHG